MTFKLTTAPEALPGSCMKCGSADRKFFVDTGLNIEFHGAIYFCNLCLEEMAQLAGYLSPESAEKIKTRMEEMELQVFNLTKREQHLEESIGSLVASGFGHNSNNDVVPSGIIDSLFNERTPQRETDLGNRERTNAEPINDKGMAELHPDRDSKKSDFEFEF